MNADFLKKNAENIVSWGVFFILLATYWLTVAPTVSYWDCPEYVAAAWKLEVGHPPGNPTWMLVERVFTMLAPSGKEAALLVNLSSGLFTAFAGFFLARTIYAAAGWVAGALRPRRWQELQRAVAAFSGALAFGWCDSTWYSAVEAEVYAMSIFMTSLCVWLMVKWAFCRTQPLATRYLILLAYIFGLSLGVHQLNLLCIPALAIIWGIKRGVRKWWKVGFMFLLSLLVVGCILTGIMPSTIALAAQTELICVNTLGLPFLSGVVIYVVLLGCSLLTALAVTSRSTNRGVLAASVFPAIFLSGVFIFSGNIAAGAALSAIASLLLVRGHDFTPRRLNICMWLLAMLLTGYSSYALIPIRGDIPSPANSTQPGDPFSFASYQAREQYGGAPLLYGNTPYSKNILQEEYTPEGRPVYSRTVLKRKHPIMTQKEEGAIISDPYRMLTSEDTIFNERALRKKGDAYIVRSYAVEPVLTPELNMWFPRITSRDPSDLPCFADWTGMEKSNMTEVPVSETLDSAGNYNTRLNAAGERAEAKSYRPTYAQSMKMLLTYQTGYMYFRYLLWNFLGRQNDKHSTGEVEHGNFITGIQPIDNAMLGAEDALPSSLGKDNKGRNRYFLLPFLLGIGGICTLLAAGKRGHKTCLATAMLFIMTGLAIVVYLNQSPGEPRERDYSFLGSYLAFAIWIGFGAFGAMRLAGKYAPAASLIPLFAVVWMFIENYDDHDRSGRLAASRITANILNSLDKDAILFVDGDNATFPLWYAQEVEGIRKDVRVINLAYLSMPLYAASMMNDWDGAKGVATTLRREEIIYGALQFPRIAADASDTVVSATEMLDSLGSSIRKECRYRKVWLKTGENDSIMYNVGNLGKIPGGRSLDFRKLIMFDIIATNASSPHPRPVYWHRTLPVRHYIGIEQETSPGLFARYYGRSTPAEREKDYQRGWRRLRAPNDLDRDVYLDGAPAGQISYHRAGLLAATKDMVNAGRLATATRLATAADSLMGEDPDTYSSVHDSDTIFNTRKEIHAVFVALADSLAASGDPSLRAMSEKFRRRAGVFSHRDSVYRQEWNRYYRTLPPHLRLKISR